MRKLFTVAALACAAFAIPAITAAQSPAPAPTGTSGTTGTTGTTGRTGTTMSSPTMATMVCRNAMSGEKPHAMMVNGKTGLVCKPLTPEMMAMRPQAPAGPNTSGTLDPAQQDAAWQTYLQSIFIVPQVGP